MVPTHVRYRIRTFRPLANALIWPAFTIAAVVILAALTGIFVMWLTWVGLLIAAIMISDLVHRSVRRFAKPPLGAIGERAIG
jgi:membrane protein implicated in regulation of membrane protease activity